MKPGGVWRDALFIDVYPVTNADRFRFTSATSDPPLTHR